METLDQLERMMDRWITVGPVSFGLDGILGLIPGIGDVASGVISAYIVGRAARDGVHKAALARMMTNIAVDSLVGAIPFAGDLFDFLFKANTKNMQIYREALAGGRRSASKDWAYVALFVLVVFLIVAVPVTLGIMLFTRLWRAW